MFNLSPPPGFQGLDPFKPLVTYRRHLPHWRQDGASYFVTFRLHDSLPRTKLRELEFLKTDWERRHPPPRSDDELEHLTREVMTRVERWLDRGMGECTLRRPAVAARVASALHHFDEERYELGCYVIMPNHVHLVVRPLLPELYPLEDILGSWKSFSGRRIQADLAREGEFWQKESFDRIIRDEEHLWRVVQYIGRNPTRAGLAQGAAPLWIRPHWRELGWDFEPLPEVRDPPGTTLEGRPTTAPRP